MKGLGFGPKTASEERIGRVRTPSLVVMGAKDPDWPDPKVKGHWIIDHLAGSSLLLVEDAGHYPQTEMPEKVIPEVLNFLMQL
jgi:pimeloyl-ACP methyl ester carboxylesterase